MDNYKTIKELADELHISKQAIRKHLDKLPSELPVTKNKNILYLSPDIQAFVRERTKKVTGDKKVTDNLKRKVTSNFDEVENQHELVSRINFLEEQIKVKDRQILDKDLQQKEFQKLLDQQQQLTLQSNKQIEQLQQQLLLSTTEKETKIEQENDSNMRENEYKEDTNLNEIMKQSETETKEINHQNRKKWYQFWK